MDLQAELERLYGQNKQRSQSLSDRLNAIDSYVGQTSPQIRSEMTDFSNRPVGYNPIDDYRSAFEVSQANRDYRTAAATDFTNNQTTGINLLKQLADLAEAKKKDSGDDLLTEIKKEALKKQVKDGTLIIDPKTGELKVDDATKVSKEGQQAQALIKELLNRDTARVQGIFGGTIPTPLSMFGEGVTTRAKIDQLKALLALGARGLLKGSGAVSDKETKMLEDSVAALKPGMSDKDFRAELQKINGILNGDYSSTSNGKGTSGKGAGRFQIERVE